MNLFWNEPIEPHFAHSHSLSLKLNLRARNANWFVSSLNNCLVFYVRDQTANYINWLHENRKRKGATLPPPSAVAAETATMYLITSCNKANNVVINLIVRLPFHRVYCTKKLIQFSLINKDFFLSQMIFYSIWMIKLNDAFFSLLWYLRQRQWNYLWIQSHSWYELL